VASVVERLLQIQILRLLFDFQSLSSSNKPIKKQKQVMAIIKYSFSRDQRIEKRMNMFLVCVCVCMCVCVYIYNVCM
jgi:uncharacterized membrane protein